MNQYVDIVAHDELLSLVFGLRPGQLGAVSNGISQIVVILIINFLLALEIGIAFFVEGAHAFHPVFRAHKPVISL